MWDGVNSFTEVRVCYMLSAQTLISSSKALGLVVCDWLMTVRDYLPALQACEAITLMWWWWWRGWKAPLMEQVSVK